MSHFPGGSHALEESRLLALARHHIAIDRPEQALATLARAQHLATTSAEAWTLRAAALEMLERYDEGATSASRALAIEPHHAGALALLGRCEQGRGDLAAAERAMLGALQEDPEDAHALALYANLCVLGGQVEKAQRLLVTAASIDPHEAAVLRGRWLVAHARGRNAEARRISEECLARAPEDTNAHIMAGNTRALQGDHAGALRHFAEGVRAYPARRDLADAARTSKLNASLWLLPIRPIQRLGVAKAWFVGIGGAWLLHAVGLPRVSLAWAYAYLALCAYSWVVFLVLRWMQWRRFR